MKRNFLSLILIACCMLFSPLNAYANEASVENGNEIEPRIAVATVAIGYRVYRDSIACPGGDCWDGYESIVGQIYYNNSFYKTGKESCSISGDVKTCYFEYNVDGNLTYIYG